MVRKLGFHDVGSLEAFRAFDDVEFDFLAFVERLETVAGDCLEVYEYVFAARLRDEAETFFSVEPFYGTTWHKHFPPFPRTRLEKEVARAVTGLRVESAAR